MNISDVSLPEVYKKSADFRFFLKWFTAALTKIQYDIENLSDLYDPERCPKDLLWALADTMGFKYDDRLPASFNRLVLLYFMSLIYNRGSSNGVTLAAEINLAQFKLLMEAAGYQDEHGVVHEPKPILYDRLDDQMIPVNSAYVTPHVAEGYIEVVYFSTEKPIDACIEYVRPVGMYMFQHAGVKFDARTKISVDARLTDSRDTNMSYGPTCVGHYRRSDYATMQKTLDITSGDNPWPVNDTLDTRNAVWYRNSVAEGEPSYDYAGYRALYSLQLSNNEETVKALIDPIFSLGFEPTTRSTPNEEEGGEGFSYEVHQAPAYSSSVPDDDPKYNLRYDQELDEAVTPKIGDEYQVYTIDELRSPNPDYEDAPLPMPAVNPIMMAIGEAISLNAQNTKYLGGFDLTTADDYIYRIEDDGVILISYIGTYTRIRVPRLIEDLPVVGIDVSAFAYNTNLQAVKLPSTIEFIR